MSATAITPSDSTRKAVEALRSGNINDFKDLLKQVARPHEQVTAAHTPPAELTLTEEQRRALERVDEVFGSVVPDTVRALEQAEVGRLLDERITLDIVKKMAASRIDDIRDTILNHSDVVAEEAGEEAPVASNGHFARQARVSSGQGDKEFSVEVRSGSVSMNPDTLKAMADDPEVDFTHEDYLACTTQTRVFDEHKAMLHLKAKAAERPGLVEALQNSTTEGAPSVAVYVRKRK